MGLFKSNVHLLKLYMDLSGCFRLQCLLLKLDYKGIRCYIRNYNAPDCNLK